jgi:dTDP-4-dehydrorhamnose reductase
LTEKVLVIGSSGLLGSNLVTQLRNKGYVVITTYRSLGGNADPGEFVDLSMPYTIEDAMRKWSPDVVVHSAALTNVDYCELHPDEATMINAEGTRVISSLGAKTGSFLVYVSTDYVFDGQRGMYTERDDPSPINVYGKSKLQGESYLIEGRGRYAIVRPSVIYGSRPSSGKDNFALWLMDKLLHKEKIKVLTDQFVSPTLASNLAEMMCNVVESRGEGVLHLAGKERIDRYSFSRRLAETFGFDESSIEPAEMSEMRWSARRPADSSLDVSKAEGLLHSKPIGLDEAFRRLKSELNWNAN